MNAQTIIYHYRSTCGQYNALELCTRHSLVSKSFYTVEYYETVNDIKHWALNTLLLILLFATTFGTSMNSPF